MKHWLKLFLIGISLSGCAVAPPNPWEAVTVDETETATPIPLPALPAPVVVGDRLELDAEQAAQIRDFAIIARANTEMAAEYARAIDDRKVANTALIEAGKAQRMQSEMRREMLEDERKHNLWNNLLLYGVIIVMGVAL